MKTKKLSRQVREEVLTCHFAKQDKFIKQYPKLSDQTKVDVIVAENVIEN